MTRHFSLDDSTLLTPLLRVQPTFQLKMTISRIYFGKILNALIQVAPLPVCLTPPCAPPTIYVHSAGARVGERA
jgi:hypothetical protein